MVGFQLVIDCADQDVLARFWAAALHYEFEPAPPGFADWDDYYRELGVAEDELGVGVDSIVDPLGAGPRIWFQQVPEGKTIKNRLHLDVMVGGGRAVPVDARRLKVNAEVDRLAGLGARTIRVDAPPGINHYAVAMADPEGNEFDVA